MYLCRVKGCLILVLSEKAMIAPISNMPSRVTVVNLTVYRPVWVASNPSGVLQVRITQIK